MNPITQKLNQRNYNQLLDLKNLANGNPQAMYNFMLNTNPQFRQFVDQNKNKTPSQIAQEHGIDMNQIRKLIG